MQLVLSNIGKEFRRQISQMFKYNPEIQFKWMGNRLEIYHPKGYIDQTTLFEVGRNDITVSYAGSIYSFKRKNFKRISNQVFDIIRFWKTELLSKQDLSAIEPKIPGSQFALLQREMKTGQVLTINENKFSGWGEVYLTFDDFDSAKHFALGKLDKGIESVIYDSNYKYVDTIRNHEL